MAVVASAVLCVVQTERKGAPAKDLQPKEVPVQLFVLSSQGKGSGRQRESHWESVCSGYQRFLQTSMAPAVVFAGKAPEAATSPFGEELTLTRFRLLPRAAY